MQYYKIVNNQTITEDNYFWKFGDTQRTLHKVATDRDSPDPKDQQEFKKPSTSQKRKPGRDSSPQSSQKKNQTTKDRVDEQEYSQCTFKPNLVADNKRYWLGDTEFLRRGELWQEQKQNKLIKFRQQETQNTLKECTFQPKISDTSKNIVFAIGQEENARFEKLSHHRQTQSQLDGQKSSPIRSQQNLHADKDKIRYEDAVAKLHKELHKIEINLNL